MSDRASACASTFATGALLVWAAAVASGALDLFEDRGRGGQFQSGAAIFFGDQDREIAGGGQRIDECAGIGHLAVELAPVFAGELRAEFGDGVADVGMVVLMVVLFLVLGHRNSAGQSRRRGRAGPPPPIG